MAVKQLLHDSVRNPFEREKRTTLRQSMLSLSDKARHQLAKEDHIVRYVKRMMPF